MILPLLELVIIICLAIYVECWRAGMRRRQAQAWERLVAQLQPNWYGGGLSDQSRCNQNDDATPEEKWRDIQGAHGLWSMYENAQVMLDMADFAARNSDSVDRESLAALRNDAMQIRVSVLIALSKYAYSQVNESTSMNVSRAGLVYAGMVDRIAELMRTNGGELAGFAGAR